MNTPADTSDALGRTLARWLMRLRPAELGLLAKAVLRLRRVVTQAGDLRVSVDLASSYGAAVMRDGGYEPGLTHEIQQLLLTGDTFVDLGANEGWFSLIAARRVGPQGKIFAIEPQERLWPVILTNGVLNGLHNIKLVPCAVDTVEALEYRHIRLAPSMNTGSTSLVHSLRSRWWTSQAIAVLSLDEILRTQSVTQAKLLKIDIEGFELQALRSGARSLAAHVVEHIIVETHPAALTQLGSSVADVDTLLADAGYTKRVLGQDSALYSVKH